MDKNISAFIKVLDPNDNSAGGGTASAVAGAMAVGLLGMVARLSLGKKNMKEEKFYREIISESIYLSFDLFKGGQLDSAAFEQVSGAYKLPKQTTQEQAIRIANIEKAVINAAKVPMANAEKCVRVLELYENLAENYNSATASDLSCARFLAVAGMSGCLENVDINLPFIKDKNLVAELKSKIKALRIKLSDFTNKYQEKRNHL